MRARLKPDDPHAEDIRLIRAQSERCREILSKIASLSSEPDEHLGLMPLSHVLEEAVAPHRDFGIAISIEREGDAPEPVAGRNPGLLYGLGNLVDNAVDFAKSEVHIRAAWSATEVTIAIADDGPGFSPDVIDQLGEPYVTTRRAGQSSPAPEHGGLGLGIFIAKTLLERSGAKLRLANRKAPETGAVATVSLAAHGVRGGRPASVSQTSSRGRQELDRRP